MEHNQKRPVVYHNGPFRNPRLKPPSGPSWNLYCIHIRKGKKWTQSTGLSDRMAESPVTYDYNSTYKTMQALTHKKFKYGLYLAQIQTPQRHNQARKRYGRCLYVVTVATEGAHNGAAVVALVCHHFVTVLLLLCLSDDTILSLHCPSMASMLFAYDPHNVRTWSLENHARSLPPS